MTEQPGAGAMYRTFADVIGGPLLTGVGLGLLLVVVVVIARRIKGA